MTVLTGIVLSFRWPGVGLAFVLLMFGIEQFFQAQDETFVTKSYIVNVGIGLIVATAAAKVLLTNPERFQVDRVHVAVLLLFAWAWTSLLWSPIGDAAYRTYRAALPYELLFFLFAPFLVRNIKDFRTCFVAVIVVGAPLIVCFAVLNEWSGRGIKLASPVWYLGRLTYESPPLALANFAATVALVAALMVPKNIIWKLAYSLLFCLACFVVYRTQSRGQLLALVGAFLIAFPLAYQASTTRGLVRTAIAAIMLTGAMYLIFENLDLGELNRWSDKDVTRAVDGRWTMALSSLAAWSSGSAFELVCGLGTMASISVYGTYVHNLPVEILAELGIVGIALYAYINFHVATKLFKLVARLSSFPNLRREVVVVLAIFIFASAASLKEQTLSSSELLFLLAILVSTLERVTRLAAEPIVQPCQQQNSGWHQSSQRSLCVRGVK